MSSIGQRIKSRRKELGISADVLADKLNVSRSTIFRYERGDIEKLPAESLKTIAETLQTTTDYLLGWESQPAYTQGMQDALLLRKINQLSPQNKQAVLNLIDNLLAAQPNSQC